MKHSRSLTCCFAAAFCLMLLASSDSFAAEPQPDKPYFSSDPEGGKKLDALMNARDKESRPDDEIIETVRNGLLTCKSHHLTVLRWFGNKYIWGTDPQNEKAIHLMIEASRLPDESIYYPAIYFGLSTTLKKTPEILKAMIDVAMKTEDYRNTTWRIEWGCRAPEDKAELLKLLEPYLQSDDAQVRTKAESVQSFLNDPQAWLAADMEKKKQKAKEEYGPRFSELKKRLIDGDSTARSELFDDFYRNNVTLILDDSFEEAFEACAKDPDARVRRELARMVGGSMIWSAKEQSPMAVALLRDMLKDSDRDVRYNAVYHGLSTVRERSDEQVAELLALILDDREPNLFRRVVWGLQNDKDQVRKTLDQWKLNERNVNRLKKIDVVDAAFFPKETMMKNDQEKSKTLRLLFPQWQGGNNKLYSLGAKLLVWLAPKNDDSLIEVPVEPANGTQPEKENGVVAQNVLLKQLKAAQNIINDNKPERIVVFGGDCLVSQAPFAYLNERYKGKLGVLWIDAHPDVSTPEMYHHEHAMVLGNLLGEGDPKFAAEVKLPLKPAQIMYAGLGATLEKETEIIKRLGIKQAGPKELATDSDAVIQWIRDNKIQHLAIHFDLDVLDPASIRSLYFSDPQAAPGVFDGVTQGKMTIEQVVRLISDASKETDIVGLSIAEHLPWDAQNLKNMLEQLPLLK